MHKLIAALITGLFASSVFAQANVPATTPSVNLSSRTSADVATPPTSADVKADDAKASKKVAKADARAKKEKAEAKADAAEEKADAAAK